MLANIAAGAAVILGYHLSQTKPKRSGWETLLPTSWVEERKRGIIPSSLSLMDVLWIAPLCVLMYWAAKSIATHYGHGLVFRDINRTLRELTEDVQTEATNTKNGVSGNSSSSDSPVDKSCEMAKTLRQSGQSEIQHSRQRPGKSAEPNEAKEAASIAGPIRPWRRGNRKVKHRPGLKNKRKPKNKHEHDLRNKLSSKLKLKFIPIQFTVLVTTAIAALKAISKTTSNIITSTAISLIALTALTSSTGTTTTKPISPLPS
ncbi:hypothetical protein ASPCAL03972 [Aspergillus calidoustus]|uniref:Uncharacterized protein n=1 Tax=Aspergillus calidoustus TaxID=454130 RepID=A0A0U5C4U8_ASPCI|nr:hypothetical protein ASPCAL03972 [Aspergillus calidoustus]